jgi:histidine triad (HIT) family protein
MAKHVETPADCIFCKIIAGQVPSTRVYEDDDVLAFMDINPVAKGHTLVVPKAHHRDQLDTPPAVLATLAERIAKVAAAVVKATQADGFNVSQFNGTAAGQVVFHIHYHIIPRHLGDNAFAPWHHTKYEEGEIQRLAEQIRGDLRP